MNCRRAFMSFLAASPLYAAMGFLGRTFAQVPAPPNGDGLIARAGDALDVFDFEPVAHRNIPPGHMASRASSVCSNFSTTN